MEQQFPIALQVALYAASCAIIAIAAVFAHVLLRLKNQLDRTVTAVEHLEAELTPLAREARVVVGVAGGLLLPPVRTITRTARIVQTGVKTFLQALWSGRQERG
jgi:hypothetical protein